MKSKITFRIISLLESVLIVLGHKSDDNVKDTGKSKHTNIHKYSMILKLAESLNGNLSHCTEMYTHTVPLW